MPLCEGDASIHGVVHAIVGLGEAMGDKAWELAKAATLPSLEPPSTTIHSALKAFDWQRLQGAERDVEPSTVVSDRHNDAEQGVSRHAWLSMSRSPLHFKVGRPAFDGRPIVMAMTTSALLRQFIINVRVFGGLGSSFLGCRPTGGGRSTKHQWLRCCSPPLNSWGILYPLCGNPTMVSTSSIRDFMVPRLLHPVAFSANNKLSSTLRSWSRPKSWNTIPSLRRSLCTFLGLTFPRSVPHTVPEPEAKAKSP